MSAKVVSELVIDVATEAAQSVAGLDDVGDSAQKMSKHVEAAGNSADEASRKFALSADGTDQLATKSSVATGALGALSSGFELVGLEKYAGGLQAASLATDFLSGVGDSLTLVMEATGIKTAFAKAQQVAYTAVTKTTAAGQWLLNAALNANPIGIVVVAVAALIGGLILLYKHSASFRAIVQSAMGAARTAVGWVVGAVSSLVTWVRDNAGGAFRALQIIGRAVWEAITLQVKLPIAAVRLVITAIGNIPDAFNAAKRVVGDVASAFTHPFDVLGDAINSVIRLIGKIHVPHINLPGGGRIAPSSSRVVSIAPASSSTSYDSTRPLVQVNTYVSGALDPVGTANTINTVQARALRRLGVVTG